MAKKITLTQEELQAIVSSAVAQALASAPTSAPAKAKGKPQPKVEEKVIVPHTFTVGKGGKTVTADRHMVHALYVRNKELAESLGGTLTEGQKVFTVVFKSNAKAKAFVSKAVVSLTADEYMEARAEAQAKREAKPKASKRPNKEIAAKMRECTGNKRLNCNGTNWELAIAAYDRGGLTEVAKIAKQYK